MIGRYNDPLVATGTTVSDASPLFIIGNGEYGEGNQSNALSVFKDGKVGIGTNTPSSLLHQTYDSNSGNGQLKLTEEGADWARLILENDQNINYWTISGRPYTNASASNINFNYSDKTGGTESGNKLRVFGNGDAILEGMLTQNSDKRLKTNIKRISNAIDIIHNMNGYSYNWKTDKPHQTKQIGLLAQEVQKALPEIVKTDEEGTLSVGYTSLVPILVEGVKEQQQDIDEQKITIIKLQEDLNKQLNINIEHEKRIAKLESMILSITKSRN